MKSLIEVQSEYSTNLVLFKLLFTTSAILGLNFRYMYQNITNLTNV